MTSTCGSLADGEVPVDHHGCAGDEARRREGKERDRLSDLVVEPDSAQWQPHLDGQPTLSLPYTSAATCWPPSAWSIGRCECHRTTPTSTATTYRPWPE